MKQIALILTLLLAAAGASAQEVFIGADFDTRFDNREHSDCNIDDSHTFFSMRLTPKAGVIWSEKNRLAYRHAGVKRGIRTMDIESEK